MVEVYTLDKSNVVLRFNNCKKKSSGMSTPRYSDTLHWNRYVPVYTIASTNAEHTCFVNKTLECFRYVLKL